VLLLPATASTAATAAAIRVERLLQVDDRRSFLVQSVLHLPVVLVVGLQLLLQHHDLTDEVSQATR
jgi:hypothetical protein